MSETRSRFAANAAARSPGLQSGDSKQLKNEVPKGTTEKTDRIGIVPFGTSNHSGSENPTLKRGATCWRAYGTEIKRFGIWAMICLLLTTQTGCQLFRNFGKRPEPIPIVFDQIPSQQELLNTLNQRAATVRQLSTNVKVSMAGMPKLKGSLQVERPNRLRLKAGLLGVTEMGVDVGSNAQQFWVWMRANLPGESPAIYYADHSQWQNSPMQRNLPLDPAWLIDAVGLVEFRVTDRHDGPYMTPDGRLKMVTSRQTSSGRQTRVVLIDAKRAQIQQQSIYDQNNQLLAYTNSLEYRQHKTQNVSLPHRIEMHVFQANGQETKMTVEAGDYAINSLFGDPDKMWAMPNPGDVPLVNLAEVGGPLQ